MIAMPSHTTYWLAFLDITSHKGRKELVFGSIPPAINEQQLYALVYQWANRELVHRGIICDIVQCTHDTVEIWCTTREILPNGFGERLELWESREFLTDLCHSFGKAVNNLLAHLPHTA